MVAKHFVTKKIWYHFIKQNEIELTSNVDRRPRRCQWKNFDSYHHVIFSDVLNKRCSSSEICFQSSYLWLVGPSNERRSGTVDKLQIYSYDVEI